MRMALGASGKHDITSVIRGLHGGSLAVEGLTSIGGARRRNLGSLLPAGQCAGDLPAILLALPDQPRLSIVRRRLPCGQ